MGFNSGFRILIPALGYSALSFWVRDAINSANFQKDNSQTLRSDPSWGTLSSSYVAVTEGYFLPHILRKDLSSDFRVRPTGPLILGPKSLVTGLFVIPSLGDEGLLICGILKGGGSKGEGYLKHLREPRGALGNTKGVLGSLKLPTPLDPPPLRIP